MIPDPSHAAIRYRPEIDGLRALAVLPVIFFHAGVRGFAGGFVGVDVFFVISGYLITSIIASDLQAGRFTVYSFYERRARRILPALFLVTLVCIPFAILWMLPIELERFARSVISATLFVPNIYFWHATSYFSPTAEEEPLLHTWSLGVEEQFYVVFPLLVRAVWRRGLRTVFLMLLALALGSLALSEILWRTGHSTSNFYLPATRAWELMIGATLALAWQVKPLHDRVPLASCNLLSGVGIGLLATAVLMFDRFVPTPSYYALVPTLGAALVISFTRDGTIAYRLLSSRPVVFVGLVSYSAYLWHQPLMAFARVRWGNDYGAGTVSGLVGLTFLFAWLSWRYVENPFRSRRDVSLGMLVRLTSAHLVVLGSFFVAVERSDGFEYRIPQSDRELAATVNSVEQGRYVQGLFSALANEFDETAPHPRILVVGDSYAQDFVNAAVEGGNVVSKQIRTHHISPECQTYFGSADVSSFIEPTLRARCAAARDLGGLRSRIAEADVVILSSSWRVWAVERLPTTIKALGLRQDQRLVVVGPKRVGEIRVRDLLKVSATARPALVQPVAPQVREIEALIQHAVPPGTFASMQDAICGHQESCALFTPSGELISHDGTHLTRAGARVAGRALFSVAPLAGVAAK